MSGHGNLLLIPDAVLRCFAERYHEMNSQIQVFLMPAALKSLEEPSCLLPGESRREFDIQSAMIIEDIGPTTNLEWVMDNGSRLSCPGKYCAIGV